MRRRRVLRMAAIGTGLLAGCVSDSPGTGSEPPTSEEGATETPDPRARTDSADTPTRTAPDEVTAWTPPDEETTATRTDGNGTRTTERTPTMTESTNGTTKSGSDVQRRLSLSSVEDVPDEHELTIEAELLESSVTASHTAHLRVTATDESSRKRRLTIGTGQCTLFNRDNGQSKPTGLWLHRPNSAEHIDRAGDRWTADRSPDDPRAFLAYGCGYAPAVHTEPIVNEYLVWDDYQVEDYMMPGTYRFARSITVGGHGVGSTTTNETEPQTEFTWGFDLAVENPE